MSHFHGNGLPDSNTKDMVAHMFEQPCEERGESNRGCRKSGPVKLCQLLLRCNQSSFTHSLHQLHQSKWEVLSGQSNVSWLLPSTQHRWYVKWLWWPSIKSVALKCCGEQRDIPTRRPVCFCVDERILGFWWIPFRHVFRVLKLDFQGTIFRYGSH